MSGTVPRKIAAWRTGPEAGNSSRFELVPVVRAWSTWVVKPLGDEGRSFVSKVSKTLDRVLRGTADANIRFDDLRGLLIHLGFSERIRGDHHIFARDGVAEILNLQPRGSEAKAYQVKQVRGVIVSHGLAGEPEPETPAEGPAPGEDLGQTNREADDHGE